MLLFKNGLVFTMQGEAFVGDVLIEGEKISRIGVNLCADDAVIIDATGKYVLPGFVDAHCHIGMWEDGMGEEGADGNEYSDPITPEMRAADGLNPFDPCFKEAREAGVTTVVTGPGSANVIGGQFVALKTYGDSLESMLIKDPIAMKAALGENPKRVYTDQKAAPYTRMAIASLFRKAMTDAQEYENLLREAEKEKDPSKKPDRDIALEALLPVLHGDLPMKFHAHRADDILTALRLAKEFGIRATIDHCTEGYLIADVLKQRILQQNVGIIIGPLLCDRSKIELRNQSYNAPRILHEKGVEFAMMTDHPVIPIQYLPICAGLAVRNGLDEMTALASITSTAAKIVGLGDRVGSITPGKDADIAIFDAHPFDFRAHCVMTVINGEIVYQQMEA
ncbi:MAG: amidohydrolase [Clostridia bacterium]